MSDFSTGLGSPISHALQPSSVISAGRAAETHGDRMANGKAFQCPRKASDKPITPQECAERWREKVAPCMSDAYGLCNMGSINAAKNFQKQKISPVYHPKKAPTQLPLATPQTPLISDKTKDDPIKTSKVKSSKRKTIEEKGKGKKRKVYKSKKYAPIIRHAVSKLGIGCTAYAVIHLSQRFGAEIKVLAQRRYIEAAGYEVKDVDGIPRVFDKRRGVA